MYFFQSEGAFRARSLLSSMDIIKLAYLYEDNPICAEFNLKSYYCGTSDNTTSGPPVLDIKICDNKPDCPDAQDEDGTLAKCKPAGTVTSECCQTYLAGATEYDHDGDHDAPNNKKPKYQDIEAGLGNILTVKFANSSRLQFRRIGLIRPEVKIVLFRKIPLKAIILDFSTIHGSFLT